MKISSLGYMKKIYCLLIAFMLISFTLKAQDNIEELHTRLTQLKENGSQVDIAGVYNKLGILYWQQGNLSKAIESFNQSLSINKQLGNSNAQRIIQGYLGLVYLEKEDFKNAISAFEASIALNKSKNKAQDIISDYYNIATAYQGLGNFDKSNHYATQSLEKSLEVNNLKSARSCYLIMAENNEKLGNSKKANDFYEKASAISKHLQQEEMVKLETEKKNIQTQVSKKEEQLKSTRDTLSEAIANIREIQAEKEKRELQILKDQAESEAREKLRRTQIFYLSIALLLFLVVMVLFIIQSRIRKKTNKRLKSQNTKIENQKVEIEKQRDLANKQRKNLTDSIQYARRIQSAVIPREELLSNHFNDSFIFYRPRDIVSGDFYWFAQKDNMFVIAAADCTGHGVPGAFMSMLGVAYLNEIVNKIAINKHINSLNADEILNQLREKVISSLHQSDNKRDPKDGMDIALCIIDFEKNKVQYSGAYNPLFIIRNGELLRYNADKMPVSYHRKKDQPFTRHDIELKADDCLYLFTDGYIDQFGGEKRLKFLMKNFSKLLLDIHKEPMWKQKEILKTNFEDWKGENTQIDDVLVMGLRYGNQAKDTTIDWSGKTILIAEDTDINFFLLSEVLKNTKANIIRVDTGVKAVDHVKANPVDLILMDINMPEMNGLEATKLVKEFNPSIPIIIQTAISEDNKEIALNAGADDYIAKPIDLKPFMDKLSKYLK